MILYADIRRIDFQTTVDWKEKQVFLKAYFPVAVHSDEVSYDIQFGSIRRPTHTNNEWDFARFEVPGHKWADLSEGGYGVALLNDCKYGWDIHGNVIGLSLIKSAVHPDETADRGRHVFAMHSTRTGAIFPKVTWNRWRTASICPCWCQRKPGSLEVRSMRHLAWWVQTAGM